jgi:hypothetical protein
MEEDEKSSELKKFIYSELAVSEILGYIMVLGLIIAAISLVFVQTSSMASDAQDVVKYRSMVQGFRKIQNVVDYTAYMNNPEKSIRILMNEGRIYIDHDNNISLEIRSNNTTQYLYESDMGVIEYAYQNYVIGFENGGVWMRELNQTSMIFEPRIFIYKKSINNETVVFVALVKIQGDDFIAGNGFVDLSVLFNSSETRIFEGGGYVNMDITSDYASAWEDYFETMRGYTNNTVLQTGLNGSTVTAQIYFDRLILTIYSLDVQISLQT